MTGFLKALILVPLGFLVILLAIANRGLVTISFDPFSTVDPLLSYTLPLWLALFAALVLGVVVGGVAAWLVQAKHRKAERQYKREADNLRREVESARASTSAPALSSDVARI
jgi:flagellar basal body-associated protein FliL